MNREELLSELRKYAKGGGGVIKYNESNGSTYYLVVQKLKGRMIHGQMAKTIGVNSISLEELAKKEGLSIAKFKPLKSA
jgi:hypothetical protein